MTRPTRRSLLVLLPALPLLAACNGTGAQQATTPASAPSASTGTAPGRTSTPGGRFSPQITTKLTIGLSYVPDIQFAPFYVAAEKGYFERENLTVTLRHHGQNEPLFGALQSGTEDIVYAGGDEMMQARSEGVTVTNVATSYQRYPVVAVVRADSGITSAAGLKGRTIGVPGQYGESWFGLLALLAENGLTPKDVTIKTIGYTQQAALMSKRVDAVMGYANNEPVRLAAAGVPVTTFTPKGTLVSVGLGALDKTVADKKPQLASVLTALRAAVTDIAADPAGAVTISQKHVPTLAAKPQQDAALASLKATLPLFGTPSTYGSQSAATWDAMAAFMPKAGLVKAPVAAKDAYTTLP